MTMGPPKWFLCVLGPWLGLASAGFTTTKIGPQPLWNSTDTDKLRQDLLLNYDKFARPVHHFNLTQVQFSLSIQHLNLNEMKSTMTVNTWLKLVWNDDKLKWNASEYGGLSIIRLAEHEIWQPDIHLYNSASNTAINHYTNSHCLVFADGQVTWVPAAVLTVFCNINLKYWPYDTQECFMKFGSWTYDGTQIDIVHMSSEVELDMLTENSEWTVTNTSIEKNVVYYPCCSEPYPDVTVNLTLSRISPSYKAVIITPATVVIVLILLCFWLPPQSGEKIVLNACAAVVICMFMIYFAQKLPAMGNHTPLIVLFYSSCLYVTTFSLIGSVIVITISRNRHHSSIPWVVKRTLTGTVGKMFALDVYIQQSSMTPQREPAEEMRDHQVSDFEDCNPEEHHIMRRQVTASASAAKPSVQQDWILLAAAIDRVSFIFYCLLFAILALVYSV